MKNQYPISLWDNHNNCVVQTFATEDELIAYLAKHYSLFFGDCNELNVTGKDVRMEYTGYQYPVKHICLRKYTFCDKDNRIIDVRMYKQQALECTQWVYYSNILNHDLLEHGDILYKNGKYPYHFRQDPVPHVKRAKYKDWIRHPRTLQELKDLANPELAPYIRDKRKNIPTYWDDEVRSVQRNWKRQSKNRHQWQK